MLTGFPESAIINVPNSVANDLLKAAEVLPLYDNKDFYSVPLQTFVTNTLRYRCPASFEWVVSHINERVAHSTCVVQCDLPLARANIQINATGHMRRMFKA